MKKIIILMLFIFSCNSAFSFEYSETDKEMFYNSFLNGYIDGMTDTILASSLSKEKQQKYISEFKKQINRDELINSSWDCIKSYPVKEIVSAAVTCTSEWTDKQAAKNKKLLETLD